MSVSQVSAPPPAATTPVRLSVIASTLRRETRRRGRFGACGFSFLPAGVEIVPPASLPAGVGGVAPASLPAGVGMAVAWVSGPDAWSAGVSPPEVGGVPLASLPAGVGRTIVGCASSVIGRFGVTSGRAGVICGPEGSGGVAGSAPVNEAGKKDVGAESKASSLHACSKALAKARILPKRALGSFASVVSTTSSTAAESAGCFSRSGGGGASRCFVATSAITP